MGRPAFRTASSPLRWVRQGLGDRLTDKGRDLWPVLTTMRQWGDKYAAPDGPPMLVTH
ncbi:MAG TPA: winged helix-turn-helix transcriptional regulator [Trebonia sp.]